MSIGEGITAVFLLLGAGFFLAGTIGLLRFPDTHSRLHALTKADNVGLGLIAVGLALQAGSALAAAKLAVIWLLAIFSSATSCYLIARHALRAGNVREEHHPRK
jgi:multicomponent Na+:H+ antiporter subunit G